MAEAEPVPLSPIVERDCFFVVGAYIGPPKARVMRGQMFVERLTPDRRLHPYPIVMIHGSGQTATTWITTPDGRPGWAPWFAKRGWEVCVVDQPARGRSAWQPGHHGASATTPVATVERQWTACAEHDLWPQARLHTQWPGGEGKGHPGDAVFDQFYASQVASLASEDSEREAVEACINLLEQIGPAVLLAHSQAGPIAWLVADARPHLVRAIVAVEPAGPPVKDKKTGLDRTYGLTFAALSYDPPVTDDDPLTFERQPADADDVLEACWLQTGSSRSLRNLTATPILVVTGEASYHAGYDHCTVRYLCQAGVPAEHLRLEMAGVRGNGHLMMLETNSDEIAAAIEQWMLKLQIEQRGAKHGRYQPFPDACS